MMVVGQKRLTQAIHELRLMEIILIIGFAILIVLNAYASYKCYRDSISSVGQRVAQITFIWAVPIIGAILALRLLCNEPEEGTRTYRPETAPDDEYVTGLGRQNSEGYISSPDDNLN